MPDEKRSYLDVLVPAAIVAIAVGSNVACTSWRRTELTCADLQTDNFVFFAGSFATFLIAATVRGVYLTLNRPISESNRRELIYLASRGVIYFLLAFGIWNLDNVRCAGPATLTGSAPLRPHRRFQAALWSTRHPDQRSRHLAQCVLAMSTLTIAVLSNYAAFLLATGANLLNAVLTQPDVPVKLDWRFGIPFVRRAPVDKSNGK